MSLRAMGGWAARRSRWAVLAWLMGLLCAAAWPGVHAGEAVRLGALAVLDDDDTQRQWQPLVSRLQQALGDRPVQLQSLGPAALEEAVAQGALDFVVTNPGHYVTLEARYGAARIATQSAQQGSPAYTVGSAVVVPAQAPVQPASLGQMRGWRVAAVAQEAFGGYQLAAVEWLRQGIDARIKLASSPYVASASSYEI